MQRKVDFPQQPVMNSSVGGLKKSFRALFKASQTYTRKVIVTVWWFAAHQTKILEWVASPLLQGIFLIQGSNPCLLHCRQILYHLLCMCVCACFSEGVQFLVVLILPHQGSFNSDLKSYSTACLPPSLRYSKPLFCSLTWLGSCSQVVS